MALDTEQMIDPPTAPPRSKRRSPRRASVPAVTAILLLLAASGASAQTVNPCTAAKTKCVTKLVTQVLKCHSKSRLAGRLLDPACVDKARAAFSDPVKGCITKAELKHAPCLTNGDVDELAALVAFFVEGVVTGIDPLGPTTAPSKCAGAKNTCVAKYVAAVLACHAKSNKTGTLDPTCVAKAEAKLAGATGCFAKAELKGDCPIVGNLDAVKDQADGEIGGSVCSLDPAAPSCIPAGCPQTIELAVDGASSTTELDLGWAGHDHDAPYAHGTTLTGDVLSCADPCGRCTFTGPIANVDAGSGAIANRRCAADTSVHCTTDADCAVGDTCAYFAGAPLPLRNGGVPFCLVQRVSAPTVGSFDPATGDAELSLTVDTSYFLNVTIAEACPRCVGDATLNDAVAAGTCSAGTRAGLACDANATSPFPGFGSTSLDCPPSFFISGPLRTSVRLSTGSHARPLSDASPHCGGDPSRKCHCDTCATAQAEPCATNADCPAGVVCGGSRCVGGPDAGTPCASGAECATALCGRLGTPSRPNACADDTGTAADETICSTTVVGGDPEGACEAGPVEGYCAPPESHLACLDGTHCPLTSTCAFEPRRCFVESPGSGAITATGTSDVPVAGVSTPTLTGLFCAGPTTTAFVNVVAGLPGPARLTTRMTVRQLP